MGASPVVSAPADLASGTTDEHEHNSDDEQDDTKRRHERDGEQHAQEEKNNSSNDHDSLYPVAEDPKHASSLARSADAEGTWSRRTSWPCLSPCDLAPSLPRDHFAEFILVRLWATGRGVISLDSALVVQELCDIIPTGVHLPIPTSYRVNRAGGERYVLHRAVLTPPRSSSSRWGP